MWNNQNLETLVKLKASRYVSCSRTGGDSLVPDQTDMKKIRLSEGYAWSVGLFSISSNGE